MNKPLPTSPLLNGPRMAFLGCSRGLGKAIALQSPEGERLFCSRRRESLSVLAQELGGEVACLDFSKSSEECLATLESFNPTHIYYVAGGGPFGFYHEKEFKDHEWAFHVNFKTPAQLIHWSLRRHFLYHRSQNSSQKSFQGGSQGNFQRKVQQFIVVGSAIAESKGDIRAASYAASKHALLGLCRSIWKESQNFDLRLFSPGYMDTDLLPRGAFPRQQDLLSSEEVAQQFWCWATSSEVSRHYCL